jgi:hypothetical protein
MFAILGVLFIVGTALSFFVSSITCGRTDLYGSPRDGALWAAIPAFIYTMTGSKFVMVLSTWIPTLLMVFVTKFTLCDKKASNK